MTSDADAFLRGLEKATTALETFQMAVEGMIGEFTMRTLTVSKDIAVIYRTMTMPKETPVGVLEYTVIECEFNGSRYQLAEKQSANPFLAMNLETGETVYLIFEE